MPPATVVSEVIGDPKSCEARPVIAIIQVVCVYVKPEFPLGRRRRSHLVRWTRTRFNVLDSSNHQFSFHKTDVNMTWHTKTNLCAVRRPEPFCSFFFWTLHRRGSRCIRNWPVQGSTGLFQALRCLLGFECFVLMERIFGVSKKARYTCSSQGNG